MRSPRPNAGLSVALVLLLAACGGNKGTGQPGPADANADANADAEADAGVHADADADATQPTDGQPPVADVPRAVDSSPDIASVACPYPRESAAGKLTDQLFQAYQRDPSPRRVIIQYRQQPVITPLPECADSGGGRTCPAREAALAAIERMVDEIQRCVVARVDAIGGQFLERFVFGNGTLVRLSQAQAADIATLTDVSQMDDGDAPGPPPP